MKAEIKLLNDKYPIIIRTEAVNYGLTLNEAIQLRNELVASIDFYMLNKVGYWQTHSRLEHDKEQT